MKPAPTSFELDPTLPWLFSDPTMQEPAAFHNMRTATLADWEPMSLYFPAGTELAMRLVTDLNQLTVGATYWHEHDWVGNNNEKHTSYHFGRYVGVDYPERASTKRRWKKGEAHITLESDVLDCDLRSYHLHEDGTSTVFVDIHSSFKAAHAPSGTRRIYQITHYVNLPAQQLATLGVEAVKQTGLTLRQAVWLEQEKQIAKGATEITTHMTGGPNLPDYRVVMPENQAINDFYEVWSDLLKHVLTPGQAKKCKSGTVAIASRTVTYNGTPYNNLEYYKVADVAPLIEWLRLHSELQRLKVESAICAQQMGHQAAAVRADREAFLAKHNAERARKKAEQEQGTVQGLRPDYASLGELAIAA